MTADIVPFPGREEAPVGSTDDTDVPATAEWQELDTEDRARFDEAWFASLKHDIEGALDAQTVVALRPRRSPWLALAAAAVLGLAGFVVTRGPTPRTGASPADPSMAETAPPDEDDALRALAREVGRAAASSLVDDEVDGEQFASSDWLDAEDDETSPSYPSLLEELDELPDSDLSTLFVPL